MMLEKGAGMFDFITGNGVRFIFYGVALENGVADTVLEWLGTIYDLRRRNI
jgi:hypothetical protein